MSDIYFKFDGIDGPVTTKGFEKSCLAFDYRFKGMHQPIGRNNKHGADRLTGHTYVGEVLLTKLHDDATIALMTQMTKAKNTPLVKIDFVTTDNPPYSYKSVKLYNVLISSFSEHGNIEYITLNFTKFETTYTQRGADNRPGASKTMGYDMTTRSTV